MTVVCGLIGTVVGLGIYQRFGQWIELLASLVPPLIGPVIAHYYVVMRMRFSEAQLDQAPLWNPAAVVAYLVGATVAVLNANGILISPEAMVPALSGLFASVVAYILAYYLGLAGRQPPDPASP